MTSILLIDDDPMILPTTLNSSSLLLVRFKLISMIFFHPAVAAICHANILFVLKRDGESWSGTVVAERFIRGAPFLVLLLFANLRTLGLIVLLDLSELKSRI